MSKINNNCYEVEKIISDVYRESALVRVGGGEI